ncbi:hypothetical protein JCM3770_001247 [Rhodotorula araucariae]
MLSPPWVARASCRYAASLAAACHPPTSLGLLYTDTGPSAAPTMQPATAAVHWPCSPPDESVSGASPGLADPLVDLGTFLSLAPSPLLDGNALSSPLNSWRFPTALHPPPSYNACGAPALPLIPPLVPVPKPSQPVYKQLFQLAPTLELTALESALLTRTHAPTAPVSRRSASEQSVERGGACKAPGATLFAAGVLGSSAGEAMAFPADWAEGGGRVDEGDGIDWSLAGPTIPPPPTLSPADVLGWTPLVSSTSQPPPPSGLFSRELAPLQQLQQRDRHHKQPDPAAHFGPLEARPLAALFPALASTAAARSPSGYTWADLLVIPDGRCAGGAVLTGELVPGPQVEKVERSGGGDDDVGMQAQSANGGAPRGDGNGGGGEEMRVCVAAAPASRVAPKRPALFRPEPTRVAGLTRGSEWNSASEFWAPWREHGVLLDAEGKEVPLCAEIETPSSFDFDSDIDAWLTYRRNFLSLRVTVSVPLGVPLSSLRLRPSPSAPCGPPIDHLEATLSAHMFPKGTPVELLQFEATRSLRTAAPIGPAALALVDPATAAAPTVPPAPAAEPAILVSSSDNDDGDTMDASSPPVRLEQQHRAQFARVQFRSSTANGPAAQSRVKLAAGGADDARFVVRCVVRAVPAAVSSAGAGAGDSGGVDDGVVGAWESAPLCVRGRSPGNFGGGEKRNKGAAGKGAPHAARNGKRARTAARGPESESADDDDGGAYTGGGTKRPRASTLPGVGVGAGVVTRRRAAAQNQRLEVNPDGDLVV